MPVHPDVDGIIGHLKINLNTADTLTRGISREQFNWIPEPGRWSVGQCITHLNMIDGQDLGRLAGAIEKAQAKGVKAAGPFRYGFLSNKFVNMMEPPITKKFNAPKTYQPAPEVEVDATIAEFRRIGTELLRLVERSRGLDLTRIKTGLSGIPLLKMSLGARLSLLATHDTRHLWQADQVMRDPRYPR